MCLKALRRQVGLAQQSLYQGYANLDSLEGGGPTFDESLDPEGKRLGYLGKHEVRGCVDVDGVGSLVRALAGEALRPCVVPGVELDLLGGEVHPVAHMDVKARNFAFVFDVSLGHVGGFVIIVANELLQV
jgi:hypothetical protein